MVTSSSPIYDENNNFIGTTTADIDLSTIQERIKNLQIGENGKSFLIDKDGLLLFMFQRQMFMLQLLP